MENKHALFTSEGTRGGEADFPARIRFPFPFGGTSKTLYSDGYRYLKLFARKRNSSLKRFNCQKRTTSRPTMNIILSFSWNIIFFKRTELLYGNK